jgi:hypothetical protein
MNEYTKQANDFLTKAKAEIKAEKIGHFPYFEGDKESRDVYQITITREGKRPWAFKFGQSIANSLTDHNKRKMENMDFAGRIKFQKSFKAPNAYDVLASITKYDPDTFENFCSDFGYDTDSRKAEKMYFAVQKEFSECNRMFSDMMEELQEIN